MAQGGQQPVLERVVTVANLTQWGAKVMDMLQQLLRGKMNCLGRSSFTLASGATTTTLTDERIGASSIVLFMPTTAHAAAALSGLYVTTQLKGSAVVNHANTADTDKTFTYAVLG